MTKPTYTLRLQLLEHGREKDATSLDISEFADAKLAFDVVSNGFNGIKSAIQENVHVND